MSDDAKKYIKLVTESSSVSVYIRRGDYEALGNCVNGKYYVKAIQKIANQQPDSKIFVFSDNLIYAWEVVRQFKNLCYEIVKYISDNLTLDDFFYYVGMSFRFYY